jgi:hypothetical protein
MNTHDRLTEPFNAWLEQRAAGRSTPASDDPADLDLTSLRAVAGQLHDLADREDTHLIADSPPPRWEDVLNAQTLRAESAGADLVSVRPKPFGRTPQTVMPGPREISMPRPLRAVPWNTAINALLAAALILAVATGIWRANGGVNLGFGDDGPNQPTIPFGGVIQDDGSIDPAELPTADDCTVEPLTVDEVLWYVTDPYEAFYGSGDIASPGPMPTEIVPATPPATNPPSYVPGPPSPEDLDAAAETQRMWMACVLADSYFQVWALEDPFFVQRQVTAVLPPLTGEDEARTILEYLQDNGPSTEPAKEPGDEDLFVSFALRGYPGFGGVHLLDTDPANSWQDAPTIITSGYVAYNEDGTVKRQTSIFETGYGTPVAPDSNGFLFLPPGDCDSFYMTWNEGRALWLVGGAPNCG